METVRLIFFFFETNHGVTECPLSKLGKSDRRFPEVVAPVGWKVGREVKERWVQEQMGLRRHEYARRRGAGLFRVVPGRHRVVSDGVGPPGRSPSRDDYHLLTYPFTDLAGLSPHRRTV